jgi:hypothetical protein
MFVYLILALIWVFSAWLYFLLNERRKVVIEPTLPLTETKTNNLRVKVDFTFSDTSDKDLLKADLVLKLNDLINGTYKLPEEFQKKVLGQAEYKEKKRKKTVRKKKEIQTEVPNNDPSLAESFKMQQPVDELDDFIAATSAEQERKENTEKKNDNSENSDGLSDFESLL